MFFFLAHVQSGAQRGKKKLFRNMVFSKTTACSSYVQPWLVAIGSWRLVEIASWRLAAVGGSWQFVMGGWWRLAAVDGWRLVAVGGWRRLAVGGSWRLTVGGPLGRSLRAVLNKKIWFRKDRPAHVPCIFFVVGCLKKKTVNRVFFFGLGCITKQAHVACHSIFKFFFHVPLTQKKRHATDTKKQ